jgi:L-iditol 2-dehydrogenase
VTGGVVVRGERQPALPGTMRAARFHGPRDVRIEAIPVPEPGDGELLVKVEAAVTNGTDAKSFKRGHPVLLPDPPALFGHEWAGTVAAVGPGCGFSVGDRVTGANSAPCGCCSACRRGRPSLCQGLAPYLSGAYAEYLLIPARIATTNVLAIPDGMPFELAAMVQTLACCLRGAAAAEAGPGRTVAVLGLGPIGLCLVAACRARGARVIGVGRSRPDRLRLASEFGADTTVAGAPAMEDLTGGEGPDAVVEAVGQPEAWRAAVGAVRRGGTVVLFGGLPKGDVPIDAHRIHYEELTVRGCYHHTPATISEALALLAAGRFPFDRLLTHSYPLERVTEPLAQAAGLVESDGGLLKAVIRP